MGTFLIVAGCIVAGLAFIVLGYALCVAASGTIPGVNEPPKGGTHP